MNEFYLGHSNEFEKLFDLIKVKRLILFEGKKRRDITQKGKTSYITEFLERLYYMKSQHFNSKALFYYNIDN